MKYYALVKAEDYYDGEVDLMKPGKAVTLFLIPNPSNIQFKMVEYRAIPSNLQGVSLLYKFVNQQRPSKSMRIPKDAQLVHAIDYNKHKYCLPSIELGIADLIFEELKNKFFVKKNNPIFIEFLYNGHKIVVQQHKGNIKYSGQYKEKNDLFIIQRTNAKDQETKNKCEVVSLNTETIRIIESCRGDFQPSETLFEINGIDLESFLILLITSLHELRGASRWLIASISIVVIILIILISVYWKDMLYK